MIRMKFVKTLLKACCKESRILAPGTVKSIKNLWNR